MMYIMWRGEQQYNFLTLWGCFTPLENCKTVLSFLNVLAEKKNKQKGRRANYFMTFTDIDNIDVFARVDRENVGIEAVALLSP